MEIPVVNLPVELLDGIFKHLDAVTLARSRQVCRTWRDLHEQSKYNLLWRRACFRDIPEDILQELLGKYVPSGSLCDWWERKKLDRNDDGRPLSDVSWVDVYQEWFRARHVRSWPCVAQELHGHRGVVYDARFSGDWVISCGEDKSVRVWDSWTKACLHVLTGHLAAVLSIALRQRPGCLAHDDNQHDLIISGSRDCTVKVWHMSSGECLHTMCGHSHWVTCVAVERDIVLSGSEDNSARIWDISKGPSLLHVLRSLGDWVKQVGFSQGNAMTVTDDGRLDLWLPSTAERLFSAQIIEEEETRNAGVSGAVLRARRAVLLTGDGKFVLWQRALHENEETPVLHSCWIGSPTNNVQNGACVAMRGNLVAIGTHSGSVCLYHCSEDWENQFSKVYTVVQSGNCHINSVALDDDGEGPCLVTAGDDGIVRVHRWFPPSAVRVVSFRRSSAMNLKIHPDALVLNQASQAGKTPEECRILKAKDYKLPLLTRYREGTWKEAFYFVQVVSPMFGRSAHPEEDVQVEKERMEKVAEALNKMKPKPRFLAICGNFTLADPGEKHYFLQVEAFKSSLRRLDSDIPVVCVCGGDIGENPSEESVQTYRGNFGEDRFSFWVEGVHFLVLNSTYYKNLTDLAGLRKEQLDWLESNVLEAQVNPPLQMIILQGSSCFSKSFDEAGDPYIDSDTEKEVISKLTEADVKAIFCGNSNGCTKEGNIEIFSTSPLGQCEDDVKPGLRIVKIFRDKICHGYFPLDDSPEELGTIF